MTDGWATVTADGVAIPVRARETVLDVIVRGGFRWPYTCRRGRCAACKVQILSGEVVYTQAVATQIFSDEERAAGVCLSCTAIPVGDLELRVFG